MSEKQKAIVKGVSLVGGLAAVFGGAVVPGLIGLGAYYAVSQSEGPAAPGK